MGNAFCKKEVELSTGPDNDPKVQETENLKFLHKHVNENMHGAFE
jgi:hypothetical protein